MNESGSPPPPEEEPPSAEEEMGTSPSHQSGRRGGDSREITGPNRSIRHSVSVRRDSAGGAASGESGGRAGGAAGSGAAGGGDVGSGGWQASSSDAEGDHYYSSRNNEYDSEYPRCRRSRRGMWRSHSPSRRDQRSP